MTWRRVPPVSSPVSPFAIVAGAGAALGVLRPHVPQLGERVAHTFGARGVRLTDSGTSALVLALRATLPRGGVVALPAYACIDLVAAARFVGAGVRFYDVDPNTISPDLDSLRTALGRGVAVVVVAPLYGYPVDVRPVAALARAAGAVVIEDAAQGAGGSCHGVRVGALGDLAILSFGRGKGTTGGSGGALLVHNPSLADRALDGDAANAPRARGTKEVIALSAQWMLGRPSLYALPSSVPALRLGEMVYHPAHEPAPISAAAARIVGWALARDPREVAHRRARAAELAVAVADNPGLRAIRALDGAEPGYLRFAFVDTSGSLTPAAKHGVLRGYPVTLDEHPATREVLCPGERAGPGAAFLRDRLFTAPTHSRMTTGDHDRLVRWLRTAPA